VRETGDGAAALAAWNRTGFEHLMWDDAVEERNRIIGSKLQLVFLLGVCPFWNLRNS
jgi:hypothetical protein